MVYEYEFIRHFEGTHFKTFFININHRLYHWHSDMELLLIIEGSVIISTAHKQYELKKDDLFLVNCNEIHSLTRTRESNTILALQFDPKFCSSYFPELQQMKFNNTHIQKNLNSDAWKDIWKCLTSIVTEYYKKNKWYQLKLMSTLNKLAYYLLKYIQYEKIDENVIRDEEKKLSRLSRILNYIQENYMNKISLNDLAVNENLDMSYLSHFIKDQLGISFREYLNKVRLEKAADLIMQTNKNYLDICMECGFSDYRYLNKAFMKEYGCLPSRYKTEYTDIQPKFFDAANSSEHEFLDQDQVIKKLLDYMKYWPEIEESKNIR